tara:strand:- start:1475 stop:1693 length:219 start_codon:yes stop_codon:yes gene_type:complete
VLQRLEIAAEVNQLKKKNRLWSIIQKLLSLKINLPENSTKRDLKKLKIKLKRKKPGNKMRLSLLRKNTKKRT